MNQSLTLAFDCRRNWSGSPEHADGAHHPDLLYHSHRHVAELTGGDCALCFYFYGLNKAWRGLANWCPACAGGHLYPACWDRFLSSPVSADIRMWSGDNYCSYWCQPANWRSDAGYLPQSWRTTTGVVRPNLWRNFTCGWRPVGSQTLHFNQRMVPPLVNCSWRASISSLCLRP